MIDLRRPGKWEFAISIAPDLSSVEFYPLAKAGFLGGASIGFHVTERWSISTGLYFTTKHYDSPGEDYPLPGNPMMKMKEVQAACNMWDIPLNLRYDLRTGTRTRFFASAGLSSYLMRKEGMHYYYTYNDIPYDRSYTSKNNQGYLFAVSNISAGLERAIGKGFSVQAEPFAKFSLAEVGTGKIRLNSYGILVGLKYRPFRVLQSRHEPHRNFH